MSITGCARRNLGIMLELRRWYLPPWTPRRGWETVFCDNITRLHPQGMGGPFGSYGAAETQSNYSSTASWVTQPTSLDGFISSCPKTGPFFVQKNPMFLLNWRICMFRFGSNLSVTTDRQTYRRTWKILIHYTIGPKGANITHSHSHRKT